MNDFVAVCEGLREQFISPTATYDAEVSLLPFLPSLIHCSCSNAVFRRPRPFALLLRGSGEMDVEKSLCAAKWDHVESGSVLSTDECGRVVHSHYLKIGEFLTNGPYTTTHTPTEIESTV